MLVNISCDGNLKAKVSEFYALPLKVTFPYLSFLPEMPPNRMRLGGLRRNCRPTFLRMGCNPGRLCGTLNQIDVAMYEPWDKEVHALIDDYEEDFGVRMSFEDACQILIHYEELIELFEKYGGDGYKAAGFLES